VRPISVSTVVKVAVALLLWILVISTFVSVVTIYPFKFHSNVTPGHLKLPYKKVSFRTADGLTLRGWFIPSVAAKRPFPPCFDSSIRAITSSCWTFARLAKARGT
jgi:hypothetical protein